MTWIKCSQRMPDDLMSVLVACTVTDDGLGPAVYAGFRSRGRWISQDKSGNDAPEEADIAFPVSHWMPLPAPPAPETRCASGLALARLHSEAEG